MSEDGQRPWLDSPREDSISLLGQQHGLLSARLTRNRYAFYLVVAMGWLVPFAVFPVATSFFHWMRVLPFTIAFVLAAIWLATYIRSQIFSLERDLQDVDFEIDLQRFEVLSRERRAEKILRMNNVQLRRYYDVNLNQNVWVFALGIGCIVAGLGIIGGAFYLVLQIADSTESKLVTAGLAAVGSVLVNYVAAIYLKLHAGTSANLGEFHSRLVETNQVLMGNLLASRIEDDATRWKTLGELSLKVIQQRPPHND